jgi:hypothetical protein
VLGYQKREVLEKIGVKVLAALDYKKYSDTERVYKLGCEKVFDEG